MTFFAVFKKCIVCFNVLILMGLMAWMVVEEECRSQVLGLTCPLDGTRIKLVWQVVCQINGVCIIFLSIGLICGLILGKPGCMEEWLSLWNYYMIVGLPFVIYEVYSFV